MFPHVIRHYAPLRLRRNQKPYFLGAAEIADHFHENAQNGLRYLVEDLRTALRAAEQIVSKAKPAERNLAYAASLPNNAPELTAFVETLSDTDPLSSRQELTQLLAIQPQPQSRDAVRRTAELAYTGYETKSSLRFLQEHALTGRPSSNFVDMIQRAYTHARHIGTVDSKAMDVADVIIDATLGMTLASFKKPESIVSDENADVDVTDDLTEDNELDNEVINDERDAPAQSYFDLIAQFEDHGGLQQFLRAHVEPAAHGDILRIHDAKLLQAIVEECDLATTTGRQEAALLVHFASGEQSQRKMQLALRTFTKPSLDRLKNAIDSHWSDYAAAISLESLHQYFETLITSTEQQIDLAIQTEAVTANALHPTAAPVPLL